MRFACQDICQDKGVCVAVCGGVLQCVAVNIGVQHVRI